MSESRPENRFKGSTIFQPYFDKKNSFFLSKNVVDMSFGCILLIRTDLNLLIDTKYTVQDDKAVKTSSKSSFDVTICFSVAYIHDDNAIKKSDHSHYLFLYPPSNLSRYAKNFCQDFLPLQLWKYT